MAVDKLVDSGKLDACCAAEAAAIIAKGGGTAPLAYDFANNKGFADAIAAIPSGGGDSNILTFSFTPASYNEQIRFDISDTFDVSKLRACCFSAVDFVRAGSYERAVTYAGFDVQGIASRGSSYHIETSGSLDVNTASSFEGNYFIPSTSGGSWQEGTTYKGAVIGVLI